MTASYLVVREDKASNFVISIPHIVSYSGQGSRLMLDVVAVGDNRKAILDGADHSIKTWQLESVAYTLVSLSNRTVSSVEDFVAEYNKFLPGQLALKEDD